MASQRHIGIVTTSAGAGAALATLVVWILSMFGVDVPGEVQGAITTIVVLVAGYLVPAEATGEHRA
jgi:hypothetical protein